MKGVRALLTTTSSLPPVVPLRWDVIEGAYMIGLQIGNGRVELVLDTGSSNISAKGADCKWTTCSTEGDDGSCTTQACPCGVDEATGKPRTDCGSHVYRPGGRFLKPHENGVNTQTQLSYGSQQDTVEHYLDSVRIPYAPSFVQCDALATLDPKNVPEDAGKVLVRDNVLVHRVTHTKGTSTSNLFGLAMPSRSGPVVLDTLYPDKSTPMVWSILLRPQFGWWAMGPLPCFNKAMYMPLLDPVAFHAFVTRFYVVQLLYVEVGPTLDTLRRVARAKTPKYCVVDTGTTYTYSAPSFGAALDKLGYDERTWFVRLALGDSRAPVVLTYDAHALKDPETPSASVLQVSKGRTLDNFTELFPGVDLLLLGAIMMQHCYWEFDIPGKRVGVQPLAPP